MPQLNRAPIPLSDAMVRVRRKDLPRGQSDPFEGMCTDVWAEYLTSLVDTVDDTPLNLNVVQLTGQAGAIGSTDFSGSDLNPGLYRASVYARITQAATTSSSLTVTISWTDGGIPQTYSYPPLTGNTTTTTLTWPSLFLHVDASSPVRYATTYASSGAAVMTYSLYVVLERVSA